PRLRAVRGSESIRARVLEEEDERRRNTIRVGLLRVVFGTKGDSGNVLKADQGPVGFGAQNDLSELLCAQQAPRGAYGVGELPPRWSGLISNLARRIDHVLRGDRVDDVRHGEL